MASRDELNEKRKLARSRHRAATRKVSRLKSNSDVQISGTKLDPRRDLGNIKKYNSKQLDAYIGELNKFTSRETSFTRGAEPSKPLSGKLWRQYQTLQKALNVKNAKPYDDIKDIFMPSRGMTVNQFQGMKPSHPVTGNPASRAPHLPVDRSSKGIVSDKQLRKLIKDTEKKLSPNYDAKVNKRDKKTAMKILSDIGHIRIFKDTEEMTAKQFSFLWNYTDFARVASDEYLIAQAFMHDPKALAGFHDTFDTNIREMQAIIKDVKNLNL